MKFKWLFFALSALLIVPGLFSLWKFGLQPSLDFVGGTTMEISFSEQHPSIDKVKAVAGDDIPHAQYGLAPNGDILITGDAIEEGNHSHLKTNLQKSFGAMTEVGYQVVGAAVGKELIIKTIAALVIAAVMITLYIAFQFRDFKFGLAAVVAMVHDSLVILGAFSLLGHFLNVKIDLLFVTAVLTTLSFSVHDTIVVFDRVRELRLLHKDRSLNDIMNMAVTQTLIRSLNNSLTVIIMLVVLVTLSAGNVKWLAVALLIGAITGTYSSIFTAVPLVLLLSEVKRPKWRLPRLPKLIATKKS